MVFHVRAVFAIRISGRHRILAGPPAALSNAQRLERSGPDPFRSYQTLPPLAIPSVPLPVHHAPPL